MGNIFQTENKYVFQWEAEHFFCSMPLAWTLTHGWHSDWFGWFSGKWVHSVCFQIRHRSISWCKKSSWSYLCALRLLLFYMPINIFTVTGDSKYLKSGILLRCSFFWRGLKACLVQRVYLHIFSAIQVIRLSVSTSFIRSDCDFISILQEAIIGGLQSETTYSVTVAAYTTKGDGARSKAKVITTTGAGQRQFSQG